MYQSHSSSRITRRPARFGIAVLCAAITLLPGGPMMLAQEVVVPDEPTPKASLDAELMMNFRDATLQTILDYLAEQAGLIVINNVNLEDRITVYNRKPITLDEAVGLLNTVLKDKGYTAIRRETLMRVVPLSEAKTASIPVRSGNNPQQIGNTDTIITQIIPIRYADAVSLATDLRPLVSNTYGELTANKSSNALIVTNTEANIRRIVEITQALDQSIQQVRDVKVFQLKYANATETATLITNVFKEPTSTEEQIGRAVQRRFGGQGGQGQQEDQAGASKQVTASPDSRSNSVVVSASPDMMTLIETVITQIDADTSAKEAVYIYHAKNTLAADLQTLFTSLFANTSNTANRGGGGNNNNRGRFNQQQQQQSATPGSASDLVGNVTAVADASTNSLLVLTPEVNFPRIKAILDDLDRPVPQVLVRVLVAELSHDKGLDIGTELSANFDVSDNTLLETLTTFGAASNGLSLMLINDDYTASIQLLETAGILDVLSRPYILTRDNQEANILVGEEVPRVTNTRVTDNGNTINTVEYEDVGIILGVTPQINEDGLVVLNVSQELSSLLNSTVQISEGLAASRIAKRTADTRIAVMDGQTVVIGGLMQERLTQNISKVPILGDIPLLGNLFKRTIENKSKTELLLFLTPEVVMDPVDLVGMTQKIRDESENIDETVEPGALQRHLDKMTGRDRSQDVGPSRETGFKQID
jgi:general secretion pathway protein D